VRQAPARPTPELWAKLALAFVLALVAAVVVPQYGGGTERPGFGMLLATGALVALATTGGLWLVMTSDLGLPASIALLAVGYNALVVLVKFVLAPHGLYQVSEEGRLESFFGLNDSGATIITGIAVFCLYAVALWVIYRFCRRRLVEASARREERPGWVRVFVVGIVVAAITFASGGLPLIVLLGGVDYIGWVFSSGVSLLVAAALAGAISLATFTLRSSAEQAALRCWQASSGSGSPSWRSTTRSG
jgi:hypothetical protein